MSVVLERFSNHPLLAPTDNWWECQAVFNCGAVDHNGRIYLLYRAVGQDGASRFGLAVSHDGVTIDERRLLPVFEPEPGNPYEWCGCEDPRITPLDGVYYITYTAASLYPTTTATTVGSEAPWRTRVALLKTFDFEHFDRLGLAFTDEVDDKDAALFPEKINGRYFMFHRRNLAIVVASSPDLVQWDKVGAVLEPARGWHDDRVGIGTPPLKTELGWLVLYHARDQRGVYRLGAMLVDSHNPQLVLATLPEPLLEPKEEFERVGRVPNVVFTCGMVERGLDYLVYYGGADRVLAGARIAKAKLLDALQRARA